MLCLARLLHRAVGDAEHGGGIGSSHVGFPGGPLAERQDHRPEPVEHDIIAGAAAFDCWPDCSRDLADLLDLAEQPVDGCTEPRRDLPKMFTDHGSQLAIAAA